MSSRKIELEGVDIAYEEHGDGFPLLAIHGFYPDRRLMTGALEPLYDLEGRARVPPSAACGRPEGGRTRHTYRRIYLDLPFMGGSGDPASVRTSDDMLRVVSAFVQAVLPPGPFLVAGESYGGYLARGLAREYGSRVAGLLLLCPMIVAKTADRALPASTATRVETGFDAGADPADAEGFASFSVVRDRYTWARSFTEVMPGVRLARAESLERLRERGYAFTFDRLGASGWDTEPFDPLFERPVLFALGRQDASTGWRDALRLSECYPRAAYAVLDMAGHNLQIEQAGLFSALVGEWLGRCEDSAQ
jgi:pimeloyl-ACP methyl ester carboxylesterase